MKRKRKTPIFDLDEIKRRYGPEHAFSRGADLLLLDNDELGLPRTFDGATLPPVKHGEKSCERDPHHDDADYERLCSVICKRLNIDREYWRQRNINECIELMKEALVPTVRVTDRQIKILQALRMQGATTRDTRKNTKKILPDVDAETSTNALKEPLRDLKEKRLIDSAGSGRGSGYWILPAGLERIADLTDDGKSRTPEKEGKR